MSEVSEEFVTLTQPLLGLRPYVLIELRPASDGSGEPALFIDAGGGAEEDSLALPLMAVTEVEPERSIVAAMLRELFESGQHDRATLEEVTRQLNPDWLDWVFRP